MLIVRNIKKINGLNLIFDISVNIMDFTSKGCKCITYVNYHLCCK